MSAASCRSRYQSHSDAASNCSTQLARTWRTMGSSLSRASVIRVNGQTVELYCGIALPSGKILSSARRAWISAFLRLDPSTKNRRRRIAGAEVEAASKLTNREEARTSKNHLSDSRHSVSGTGGAGAHCSGGDGDTLSSPPRKLTDSRFSRRCDLTASQAQAGPDLLAATAMRTRSVAGCGCI
jgi:hypothetical protein